MQSSGVDGNVEAVVVSADDIENLTAVQQPSAGNTDDQNSASLQNLPGVLNDLSLMYILQQQQQPTSGVSGESGANMMMMSPAALQSLLVSQMVAAVNSGMSYATSVAQSVTGAETSVIDGHQMSPPTTQPSLQHNGSTPDITNISMSLPSVPDGDLRATVTAKLPLTTIIPPKKPLTPYMKFSKSIWQHVKNANPSMSVCEVGASIGRLWREMCDADKQQYNDDFSREKIQYEAELQEFLKVTGMHASDVAKLRPASSKKTSSRDRARSHGNVVSSSPQSTLLPTGNQESVAVSSVLPHIAQIWPPCNSSVQPASLQNGSDAGEMHVNASVVNRSVQSDLPTNASFHASLADSLMQPLFSSNTGSIQSVWQDTNVDNIQLPVIDPLCPELATAGLADGLEPGEVVFEGGVAQIGPTTKPSISSAHNLYNSYAYNPWARFRDNAGLVVAPLTGAAGVCERDGVLRAELKHLHAALEEKTREVGELTRDLQNAYDTINKIRQFQNDTLPAQSTDATSAINDPPSLGEGLAAGNCTAENSVPTFADKVDGIIPPEVGQTISVPVDIELTDLCSELEQAGNDIVAKSPTIHMAANVASASTSPV